MHIITESHQQQLPQLAINIPSKNQYLVDEITLKRQKYPFPAGYIPQKVEIFFQGSLAVKLVAGQKIFEDTSFCEDYEPQWTEWKFDDECAFLQFEKNILVNRTINMISLDTLLKSEIQPEFNLFKHKLGATSNG